MTHGLFASLYEAGQPFALIDTRERRDHVNGHWFGSTNIPLSNLKTQVNRLVPDTAFPIHLLDWQDEASRVSAKQLTQLGYTNVTVHPTTAPGQFGSGFVKGEFVWSKAFGEVVAHTSGLPELTPAEYLADHSDALLFDVRPTAEYAQFTIPGSQSLPNSLVLANMAALRDTGKMALLHCAGRTRSIIGACTLKAAGYDGPFAIFKGGTQSWQLDGHEREHGADRLFARESDDTEAVQKFLRKWDISWECVEPDEVGELVAANRDAHVFDVSDDSATGQGLVHGIIKISGTNLIQQTDQVIARYHVPVILFDLGSGSRAAFAAYWLQSMGYEVRIVYLPDQLAAASVAHETSKTEENPHPVLSADQLLSNKDETNEHLDFRSSQAFRQGHLRGSQWRNVGAVLRDAETAAPPSAPVMIIGKDISHGCEVADILVELGWTVAGIHAWDSSAVDPQHIESGDIDSPIDESNLFAGRHHGNMQDSRDYLTWEEDLPGQIDQQLHQLWLRLLRHH